MYLKKTFCFDLDGVICKTYKKYYSRSKPYKSVINLINSLYDDGNSIIIFTARYMGRSLERESVARKKGYSSTFKQLNSWGLKFHKLRFGKPSYDVFIDDKNFSYKKNWIKDFKKKYKVKI
jgi:hypothetical protein